MSTKVVRNAEVKAEKREEKLRRNEEVESLRNNLKEALRTQGIHDIVSVFKRFDTNGDGYFNMTELGCAFTVLKVDFSQENLRKLVRMTDTNNDGKVSFQEFERMIDAEHVAELKDSDHEEIEEVPDEDDSMEENVDHNNNSNKRAAVGFSLADDDDM